MSQEEPAEHPSRAEEVQRIRFLRAFDQREARTVGLMDGAGGAPGTSLKVLAKTVLPIVGVILVAVLISLMGNISTATALILLGAQTALVIFGLIMWFHKPKA